MEILQCVHALCVHLFARKGHYRFDYASSGETKIPFPFGMGADGSNSEIRFHSRFKVEGAANSWAVFVFRATLLGEITPRYGRNLAALRAEKALGRRKTCPGRNDDWIR